MCGDPVVQHQHAGDHQLCVYLWQSAWEYGCGGKGCAGVGGGVCPVPQVRELYGADVVVSQELCAVKTTSPSIVVLHQGHHPSIHHHPTTTNHSQQQQ